MEIEIIVFSPAPDYLPRVLIHFLTFSVLFNSDTLRTKAAEGRSATLDLAQAINEFQSKIRATTHKMMATVSELSMYQVWKCGNMGGGVEVEVEGG